MMSSGTTWVPSWTLMMKMMWRKTSEMRMRYDDDDDAYMNISLGRAVAVSSVHASICNKDSL